MIMQQTKQKQKKKTSQQKLTYLVSLPVIPVQNHQAPNDVKFLGSHLFGEISLLVPYSFSFFHSATIKQESHTCYLTGKKTLYQKKKKKSMKSTLFSDPENISSNYHVIINHGSKQSGANMSPLHSLSKQYSCHHYFVGHIRKMVIFTKDFDTII